MSEAWESLNGDFEPHQVGDRTGSAAMLAWYLENVERIDDELVPDFICDGNGDKGIDALVVDDDDRSITILQAKRMDSPTKTQGDRDLKNLIGAAAYFRSVDAVDGLLASKPNPELRRLLLRQDVRAKVEAGYSVKRVVFVTNAVLDSAGIGYVDAIRSTPPQLDVWDRDRLLGVAERVRRADMRSEHVRLTASSAPIVDELGGQAKLAIALVSAKQLVQLPGIQDQTLFSRNVRLSVGNTRINKELAKTVNDPREHAVFPAAHNGITALTLGLEVDGDTLHLDSVSIVNGCQSILALHRSQDALTDELRLLVKVVELPSADSDLSDTITYRANNQNAVNMRDQRSTDAIQLDLQRQVARDFGTSFAYAIKTGEQLKAAETLENTLAAQLLMAVYRKRPWAAVRKVRLFDQDYHDVFGSDVNAATLRLLKIIDNAVEGSRDDLHGELRSSFASVKFTIASLVADVLRLSPLGLQLLAEPEKWLPALDRPVSEKLRDLAREATLTVNGYVSDTARLAQENGDDFDAKTVFKSAQGVLPLKREVETFARRLGERDGEYLFNTPPAT